MAFPLNPVSIAEHAARAGFRKQDLVIAVAVALAESQGYADRAGGLWNLPGEAGGDPAGNAVKAYARFQTGGWGQWSSYRGNRYLLWMPAAGGAVAAEGVKNIVTNPVGVGQAVGQDVKSTAQNLPLVDSLDAAKDALTLAYKAGAWVANPQNWIRVSQVITGGALIVVAAVMIIRPERVLTGVESVLARGGASLNYRRRR